MELDTIVRFHAKDGLADAVAQAMRDVCADVRAEAGCIFIHYYRSTRNPRLFFIHSCWQDEPAFELHAALPHTLRFLATVEPLIDHPVVAERTRRFL